jgi:hypothetical protein
MPDETRCASICGIPPAENRIPKSDKKQVTGKVVEETNSQEEKDENAEDSEQSPKHKKR